MNKQPSFFIKKWKYIQWMYIFCCYQQSHLWVEKNNLNKCFVFPSRNLFMLLVYLHPAHIDVQCYRVGFQLVYLIQWQVRIMTGRRKKAVHKFQTTSEQSTATTIPSAETIIPIPTTETTTISTTEPTNSIDDWRCSQPEQLQQ